MRGVLIRLTNVALFALACWLVSVVFNEILAERLRPSTISVHAGESQALVAAPAWNERKVIIDRNLFGARVAREPVKQPPPPVVEEREDVEETKLPLELLGTLWSSDSAMSTAAIRDTGNRIEQVVAVGESLEERSEVKVATIERGRVILLNGSRREELLLSENGGSRGGASSAASPSRRSRGGSRSPVASRGGSRSSGSSLRSPEGESESPAAKRRAARTSRANKQARKRAMTGKERMAEANRLATGKGPTPKATKKTTPRPRVTAEEQQEAGQVMKSLLDSGAGPDEILRRMQELENRHLGDQ